MSDEHAALVAHIDATATVTVVTTRTDGTPVATPVWAVVVDGMPYMRAAFGDRTVWYRRATGGRPVAVTLADGTVAERDPVAALSDPRVEVRVSHIDPADQLQEAITEAYKAKYLPISPEHVPPTIDDAAVARTIALLPR